MLPEAESWLESEINLKGSLAGIPVSLKDSVHVKGFDATVGYAAMAEKPILEDGPMVKLLKDAGKIMTFKTRFLIVRLHTNFSQALSRMLRLLYQLHCSLSSQITGSGVNAATRMSQHTRPVGQPVERQRCWHRVAVLVLDPMLLDRCAFPPPGVVFIRFAAALAAGPRAA